jgi:TRAP transporter 4TM/12TM fusion protein
MSTITAPVGDVTGLSTEDLPLDDARQAAIIEEFESESPVRQASPAWKLISAAICFVITVYALYWTQFSISPQVYRATFLLLALCATFLLYPAIDTRKTPPTGTRLVVRLVVSVVMAVVIGRWILTNGTPREAALVSLGTLALGAFPLIQPFLIRRPASFEYASALVGAVGLGYVAGRVLQVTGERRFNLSEGPFRVACMIVCLLTTAAAIPLLRRSGVGRNRVLAIDIHLCLLTVLALGYIAQNFQSALDRASAPQPNEILLGTVLIVLVLEATRRTTGWALPLVAIVFIIYCRHGNALPVAMDNWIGHRGFSWDRIVGQNLLTLEGIFNTPIEVAATFIVLFSIYGAVLEFSGAGKFFIDWSFAALGRSRGASGPGRTVTAAGFLLGTVSGSGVATTVTLGSLTWPILKKSGFQKDTAGGLLSAAGIGALLSPPTLGAAAFIIAEYLEVSYLKVLAYATIPTVLYYLSCLLMMEADARRQGTKRVEAEVQSVKALTLRYGYHFSSLLVIVVLMSWEYTAFLAVFWSIVVAYLMSFLSKRDRLGSYVALVAGVATSSVVAMSGSRISVAAFWGLGAATAISLLGSVLTPKIQSIDGPPAAPKGVMDRAADSRWVKALEGGGRGSVSITATCAVAGIIVSVVGLTGLGQKLSGLIVDAANGKLILTVAFAALAVWVLGLAIPVTASYIIAAVIIPPALEQLGVAPEAAHMFIFYYAVLADVSPPTALAPFAAAAITGGNPFKTTMMAWKYCMPAFLTPFIFCLSADGVGLLMVGSIGNIVWTSFTAIVSVCALAIAFGGWLRSAAIMPERIVAGIAGLALMYASVQADVIGFALLGVVVAAHVLRTRGKPTAGTVVGVGT